MIDRKALLEDLQELLPKIEADLLERSESVDVPDVGRKLRGEYIEAQAANRTAQNYEDWRSDAITQVAAAWVLSCVFVRFLEDNQLVPTPKIAGPGEGLKRARDEHELYFRSHPMLTDRDYLLAVFDGLTKHAATKYVFGAHNPLRDLPNWLSGDAAGALITFFQRIDPNTGVLVHDFTDPEWDTRFLGDLYQDLSEEARKKYALLQTPVFVEEFILDRTLDPAIDEFGLAKMGYETRLLPDGRLHPDDRFKMIDPACGSGHFLLGSFARLVDRWRKKDPGAKMSVLVQRALDGVHGVDVNPYAIAIARFRLLLAALKECGITRLSDAPGFEIHLACGDSLLHGSVRKIQQMFDVVDELKHVYQPEDPNALSWLLKPGSYHSVVANPPYITPKDAALNAAYRERFVTCHRQYSLAVPFLERIVSLAVDGGFTGQITANSFMKREFGKKLVESYMHTIDLTHVIDTQCVHLPAHGTATAMLLARRRAPVCGTVRLVSTLKNEEPKPAVAERGRVWLAVVAQVDNPGSQSEFVTVSDMPREQFLKHPWSIGGGGSSELKTMLDESATTKLTAAVRSIGFFQDTHADEAFVQPNGFSRRLGLSFGFRPQVRGDDIRDWKAESYEEILFPYCEDLSQWSEIPNTPHWTWLYALRTELWSRSAFGGGTYRSTGRPWFDYHQFPKDRARTLLSITFAFVATHNHFVFDRGGKVFNRSAPVIKLPQDATEGAHLALLGVLNSSTACFWMKQVFQDKGGGGIGGGISAEAWERRFEHDGTKLKQFPLPEGQALALAKQIDAVAQSLSKVAPSFLLANSGFSESALAAARQDSDCRFERMIALQEELDWDCYRLYGLLEEDATSPEPPPLKRGQRAFEIVLARKIAAAEIQTTWFERHGSTPITELPGEWPDDYRQLVERRIALIEHDPNIALIEQPEYKRRWNTETWESQLERALNNWLLDRLESYSDFDGRMNDEGKPTARLAIALITVGKLADIARQDGDFLQVGELYRDDPAFDVTRLVAELVEGESIPLLSILRYKPSGLRKREEWENTWTLQRREDAIDARTALPKDDPRHLSELDAKELKKKEVGTIPVPPKYTSADFLKGDYWRLRGKLDVPKERWVCFPHCEGEDGTLMVAWAGYDHLQLARAISAYYVDVQERLGGRDDPRLVPLLACLIELLPWLKQWHNEVDPEFGVPMGDYFEGFLQEESRNLGLTLDEIKRWKPPERSRGRSPMKPKRKTNAE